MHHKMWLNSSKRSRRTVRWFPYFVVHRKDLKYNGSQPNLDDGLWRLSGREHAVLQCGIIGKLWLERGGVYVLANIRGGGEFGPAWHEAGLKTHRQRIYDDFAAVGQDLVTRQITSPRRLGITGDSNGGLLMGVEFTQHPEMWNAVIIGVPLLDMLRYEQIAAGASWVGEYGSVSVPEERAFLASISPYNQLRPDVNYPEPLIFTTTKDDRVGTGPRQEVRSQAGGVSQAVLLLRDHRRRTQLWSEPEGVSGNEGGGLHLFDTAS